MIFDNGKICAKYLKCKYILYLKYPVDIHVFLFIYLFTVKVKIQQSCTRKNICKYCTQKNNFSSSKYSQASQF